MLKNDLQKGLFTVAVGVILWFMPVPAGLKPQAWHMFAMFVATIVGFILHPLPIGAIAFIACALSGFIKLIKPAEALSGFGNATIWLIVSAFLFAKGFVKTGLGKRIAYMIMEKLGDSSLKLAYTMAITDLIVAPATPSNTARGGGILFPIITRLCNAFGSTPDDQNRKKLGSFLMSSSFHVDCVTSSMFITSVAPNSLCVALAAQACGIQISWGMWALACAVPGLLSIIITPLLVYKLEPPEIKNTPEAPQIARAGLEEMGPVKKSEKVVFASFIIALVLWATSSMTGLNATMIAMVCVGIMLVFGAIEWSDVTTEKAAWDTLVWMGGLMSLATALNKSGFVKWFATQVGGMLGGMSWVTVLLILAVIYMYSHYGFASLSAHVAAMYAAFLAVAVSAGAPAGLAAMTFASLTGIMGCLTHYATVPAPIYFGAGYLTQAEWWKIGFVVSILYMICFVGIGPIWWSMIGLY